jgi:hypothetical protein
MEKTGLVLLFFITLGTAKVSYFGEKVVSVTVPSKDQVEYLRNLLSVTGGF